MTAVNALIVTQQVAITEVDTTVISTTVAQPEDYVSLLDMSLMTGLLTTKVFDKALDCRNAVRLSLSMRVLYNSIIFP